MQSGEVAIDLSGGSYRPGAPHSPTIGRAPASSRDIETRNGHVVSLIFP